jgi:hypothetical protein
MSSSARDDLSLQKTQPLPWLWPDRIALGRLTLIDGDPGQGKSLLALDLAARLTTGRELPDGYQPGEPANVMVLCREDNLGDTVVPRLRAAGADLERVHDWDEAILGPAVFPQACPQLQHAIRQTEARLVIFDTFLSFLGQEISSLNDLMIRRALEPLAGVAEETQAALLLIRHLNKCGAGKQAVYRGQGSIAILGRARTAFLVGPDPTDADLHVLACTKTNLAAMPAALGFGIVPAVAGTPRIDWQGPVEWTADDLVATGRKPGEAIPRAVRFLEEHLADGPCDRQTLLEHAQQQGLSFRTLERAKAALGVVSQQRREEGRNVWYWSLGG